MHLKALKSEIISKEQAIYDALKLDFKKSNVKHPEISTDGLMQSNLLHIFFDVETGNDYPDGDEWFIAEFLFPYQMKLPDTLKGTDYFTTISVEEGIITNMKALRPDEIISPIHSIYVDQWDWELVIGKEDRTKDFLKHVVRDIYHSILQTEKVVKKIKAPTISLSNSSSKAKVINIIKKDVNYYNAT